MTKCIDAMENPTPCGKDICCFECDKRETCEDVCSLKSSEGCSSAIQSGNEVAVFESSVLAITEVISNIAKQKEQLDAEDKKMREELEAAMNTYGINSFENQYVKITHVDATTKTTVDSKKLKVELPEVYEKYSKISNVKGYVKISVK